MLQFIYLLMRYMMYICVEWVIFLVFAHLFFVAVQTDMKSIKNCLTCPLSKKAC